MLLSSNINSTGCKFLFSFNLNILREIYKKISYYVTEAISAFGQSSFATSGDINGAKNL